MALYIQHGYGKADRMPTAVETGDVNGIIFSARNEKPASLANCIADLRALTDAELLLDPQFYISTLVPPQDGYLPEYYPYYHAGRTPHHFTNPTRVAQCVRATLDFQLTLNLDRLVSPTVIFDSFNDQWHHIALTLADASLEYHASLQNAPPLLLSFVLAEAALDSRAGVEGFLDAITLWDMDGVYLIVAREESSYNQAFGTMRFAHLMYLVHVLSDRNGFRTICGYSDFCGLLLRAAGATAFATGWFTTTLRQFHRKSFLERRGGGQPARLRYSSGALLNSILLSELDMIAEVDQLQAVLSGVDLDEVITAAPRPVESDWNQRLSELHHWQTLRALDRRLTGQSAVDIVETAELVAQAQALYAVLKASGVPFQGATDESHLADWSEAITIFRALI